MKYRFLADLNPDQERCSLLAASAPYNPFSTWEYLAARAENGEQPWLLGLSRDDAALTAGCFGFVTEGRLTKALDIPSLPYLPDHLRHGCRGLDGTPRQRRTAAHTVYQ